MKIVIKTFEFAGILFLIFAAFLSYSHYSRFLTYASALIGLIDYIWFPIYLEALEDYIK